MQLKYSLTAIRNDRIPLLEIRITNKHNNKSTNYVAMLDSGAFVNVFHSDIAEVLGIDLSKIKETVLFGGVKETKRQMRGKPYVVKLMVIQKGKSHKFDAYVVFSNEVAATGYALLGRQGFFDQFDEVCFKYKTDKFYLQKN